MYTFDQVQKNIKINEMLNMERLIQDLERNNLSDSEKRSKNIAISNCRNNIDNIGEVTTIEIGAETNGLIRRIQEQYKHHVTEYYDNFEGFMAKYILGSSVDKNGNIKVNDVCTRVAISSDELSYFKGQNPLNKEVIDNFIKGINQSYGTNIPLTGVEEQALNEYSSVAFSGDELAKAEALVHLKEIQRDSGSLRTGPLYHPLATNKEYQEAKSKCSSRGM